MSDLGSKAADRRQPFGLNQTLFHRPQIGAILKHMNELGMLPLRQLAAPTC